MLKIVRVDVVDDQTLDIELSNGHLILFDMRSLISSDPNYGFLAKGDVLIKPQTDGKTVFWTEGSPLSLERIINLLGGNN